jgi:hypothetical protein
MASYEWMQGNSAGPHKGPVRKVLLHTTEGTTIEGACAAYQTYNSWPHQTVDARFGRGYRVCGHLSYDVAGRSLRNLSGGVETNTSGVIQIEVVGFATKPGEIDWAWIGSELVGPICRQFGIPIQSSVQWVAYPASYGQSAHQRLSGSHWNNYAGVLGHQHAPENDHGDPGAIPIELLLDAASNKEDTLSEAEVTNIKAHVTAEINRVMAELTVNHGGRLGDIWTAIADARPFLAQDFSVAGSPMFVLFKGAGVAIWAQPGTVPDWAFDKVYTNKNAAGQPIPWERSEEHIRNYVLIGPVPPGWETT